MQAKSFKCPKHPSLQISFFCTPNQWHFIPLCNECIPTHTQNHAKNFKVTLESYAKVQEKAMKQNKQAIQQYKKRLVKINQYLKSEKKADMYRVLEQNHIKILELVNNYFDSVKKLLDERMEQTCKYQKELLQRLESNVKADIEDLQNVDRIKEVEQWSEIVKKLYFKDGMSPYLEQIDDLLKDHQERIFKRKDLYDINSKKLQEDIKKILSTHIFLNKLQQQVVEEKTKAPPPKEQKKQPKITLKSKICRNCGGEMQYLTQLKKHLYCPNCGGKQRNYIPKKQ